MPGTEPEPISDDDLNRIADSFQMCMLTMREQLFPLYQPLPGMEDAERSAA